MGPLQAAAPRPDNRIPELDGLRGLAILLVVLLHYVKDGVTGTGIWYSLGLAPLRLAGTGVDLFFVLSGFLIGGILLDVKTTDTYYRTFYLRRFHRILPVYFLWLLLFACGLALADPRVKGMFNQALPIWSYPLFLQNFAMAVQGTFGAQWLMVTWSLAVEEQFYLLPAGGPETGCHTDDVSVHRRDRECAPDPHCFLDRGKPDGGVRASALPR